MARSTRAASADLHLRPQYLCEDAYQHRRPVGNSGSAAPCNMPVWLHEDCAGRVESAVFLLRATAAQIQTAPTRSDAVTCARVCRAPSGASLFEDLDGVAKSG